MRVALRFWVGCIRCPQVWCRSSSSANPPHLYLGKVELEDGSSVWGVLCEQVAVPDKPEITWFGGWRSWRAHMSTA